MDLTEVMEQALETLTAFSIPLYQMDDYDRPALHGTGFFVRVGEHHYLVSAAHVMDTAKEKSLFYYTSAGVVRTLRGKLSRSPGAEDRDKDLIDIGVLRLTDGSVPPYPDVNKFAMELDYLRPRYLPREKRSYAMIGFPATKTEVSKPERTVVAAPYAFRCLPVPEAEYALHSVNPETHILLQLNRKVGYDSKGRHTHFPKPHGMSGAPIIVLYSHEHDDDPRVFPVVAVATTYREKEKIIIGTDVKYVLDGVARAA